MASYARISVRSVLYSEESSFAAEGRGRGDLGFVVMAGSGSLGAGRERFDPAAGRAGSRLAPTESEAETRPSRPPASPSRFLHPKIWDRDNIVEEGVSIIKKGGKGCLGKAKCLAVRRGSAFLRGEKLEEGTPPELC
ncbi:hypothetical protein C4D60_Mb01t28080 [Musa balbisiana]|uniref:Uncharacterized protein n=1 Tax=Musa balbisiana TaxID=52838 RepID=A0A4S8JRA2_MUSBA|nr:hypothetical protein C4D60_Mb01t28080 [Musa balbisiana]